MTLLTVISVWVPGTELPDTTKKAPEGAFGGGVKISPTNFDRVNTL